MSGAGAGMDPLAEAVQAELRRFGPEARLAEAVGAWPAAVGSEIARNAWPARFRRDGTLVVHARDAVWSFELTHRAAEISARLPGSPPLAFAPGPLPEPPGEDRPAFDRAPPRASPEEAAQAAAWAAAIAGGELRNLVERAARASLARAAAARGRR